MLEQNASCSGKNLFCSSKLKFVQRSIVNCSSKHFNRAKLDFAWATFSDHVFFHPELFFISLMCAHTNTHGCILRNASLEEENYRRNDRENREKNNCGILA